MAAQNLLLFFRALACSPRSVGAIAPSGANLASLITSEITAASGPVLELGPGTGVFTEALLERGVRESDLTLIEYGSDFMRLLQARFPRARVLWMDAAWMASYDLFEKPLGAVISGLPLLNFSAGKVTAILTAAFSKLRDGGSFYQFTYGMQCPISKTHLDEMGLKASCMGRVLLNVPPASCIASHEASQPDLQTGSSPMPVSMDVSDFVRMLVEAGPAGIAAVALAEKFFPVVPSYVVFVLLGMTVASGQGDLAVTVAATVTGSTLGALGWYCLGLALGPKRAEGLIERFGRFVFLKPALYHRMAGAYRSNHFWVTVLGQTIPAVRIYLSIPAGVLQLAIANFVTATLIGSLLWSGPLLTLGYVLREQGADAASLGLLVVTALVGLELVVLLGWRLIRNPGNP